MNVTITITGDIKAEDLHHLKALFGGQVEVSNGNASTGQAVVKNLPKAAPAATAKPAADTDEELTDDQITTEVIRELATAKGTTNKQGVKALLIEFNAAKMSALKKEDYPAFYKKLKAL